MKNALVVAIPLVLLSGGAAADTANVRQGASFLQPVASASAGASAPRAWAEREAMFRSLDIDGDGFVSKAEAAGNAFATMGFDRADRNRDGKLSFAEFDSIGQKAAPKRQARSGASASAGGTKAKAKAKSKTD